MAGRDGESELPAEGDLSLATAVPSSNRRGRFTDVERVGVAQPHVKAGSPVICKSVGLAYEGSNPSPATPGRTALDQRKRGSGAVSSVRPSLQTAPRRRLGRRREARGWCDPHAVVFEQLAELLSQYGGGMGCFAAMNIRAAA
jgi:hypothetical protein